MGEVILVIRVILVVQGTPVLRVRLGLQAQQARLDRALAPHLEADPVTSHKLLTSHLVAAIRRCFRLELILGPTLERRRRPLRLTSSNWDVV